MIHNSNCISVENETSFSAQEVKFWPAYPHVQAKSIEPFCIFVHVFLAI